MHWIVISGSWRTANQAIKQDVSVQVKNILHHQNRGIIVGGALGVDYTATNTALTLGTIKTQFRLVLPTPKDIYFKHYLKRAQEGIITSIQAHRLITQIQTIFQINPQAITELKYSSVNQHSYYQRNSHEIELGHELIAYQINHSQGTQDTINKARQKGIPVTINRYTI